jgi:hypoxanthine phosphoribosyltransferase
MADQEIYLPSETKQLHEALARDDLKLGPIAHGILPQVNILDDRIVARRGEQLTDERIRKRAGHIATEIARDYGGEQVTFLTVLGGAATWAQYLQEALAVLNESVEPNQRMALLTDFVKMKSYTGLANRPPELLLEPNPSNVIGKQVFVVEDIIDSGNTMKVLLRYLLGLGAASVRICTMLDKESKRLPENKDLKIDYCGYKVGPDFLIGQGLGYRGLGHELLNIYTVIPSGQKLA